MPQRERLFFASQLPFGQQNNVNEFHMTHPNSSLHDATRRTQQSDSGLLLSLYKKHLYSSKYLSLWQVKTFDIHTNSTTSTAKIR